MSEPNGSILGGLRVIEVSAFVAAPLGGMTLAQLGAEVIRIDPPGGGLDYRRWPVTGDAQSLFWAGLNKAKRSVVIDTARSEGRELAMALICAPGRDAGILLTNFPPRGWLKYEELSRRRADLIQLTIQGNRNGGSMVDYTVNPTLGLPYLTGPESAERPVNHVLPAWDLITGQLAAVGLLTAERHRYRHGHGQHVKLALEDVGLSVMAHLGFLAEAQLGQTRERHGNDLFGAFGRDFVCADGERVMVVGLTRKQWKSLVEATEVAEGIAALEAQCGFSLMDAGNRFRARTDIARLIARWTASRSLPKVAEAFDRFGVCWSHYQTVAQMAAGAAVNPSNNSMFSIIEQPGIGRLIAPAIPLDFSLLARPPAAPAPRLGEHTEAVLLELLGLTSSEYGRLHDNGVVSGD